VDWTGCDAHENQAIELKSHDILLVRIAAANKQHATNQRLVWQLLIRPQIEAQCPIHFAGLSRNGWEAYTLIKGRINKARNRCCSCRHD